MSKIKISPAEQRVVILPDTSKEKVSSGGIIIPDTTQEDKPMLGLVVATGTGSKDNPMDYTIGQKVMFSQYAGLDVDLNLIGGEGEKSYKVMNQMDIMAVIEEVD